MFSFCSQRAKQSLIMSFTQEIHANTTAAARIVGQLFALLGLTAGAALGRIPRELHRQVLRVLRPAESAVRRLILALARSIVVKPGAPRAGPSEHVRALGRKSRRCFSLFDPRNPLLPARAANKAPPRGQPRISFFGDDGVRTIALSRTPAQRDEFVASSPLVRRLEVLKAALNDLPSQARRMARAMVRRRSGHRLRLMGPLRPGRPPGFRRRAQHEVDHVLNRCDWLAREILAPDTS
jgi:hypothetical protein